MMSAGKVATQHIIDSHHHFWRYSAEEYGWMDESMTSIRRDFLPEHLLKETLAAGVDGVVSVQARQTVEETRVLCGYAEQHSFIKGVVGWVPLLTDQLEAVLEELASHKSLKAVRHVAQDEPDDFLLREDFNQGIAQLAKQELVYDILIFERQLPAAIELVDRHPNQPFVLDHIAKPKIGENELEPWRTNFSELAKRDNVVCKISGMVTEADYAAWTPEQLQPYWDVALEAFGPQRLMFGSDWPVSTLACDYQRWLSIVQTFAAPLTEAEQHALFFATASRAYNLGLH